MCQRVVYLVLAAATIVELHFFIVLHPLFDTQVVRDARVCGERVIQGQILNGSVEMRSLEDVLRLVPSLLVVIIISAASAMFAWI